MSDWLDTLIIGLAMTVVFFILMRFVERFIVTKMAAERDERRETYESLFDQVEPTCPRCGQPITNPVDTNHGHGPSVDHGRETRQQRPRSSVD